MSAKVEADVAALQAEVKTLETHVMNLNIHFIAAMEAMVERVQMLEAGNNAIVEGTDIEVKAAPNGKIKKVNR